MPNTIKKIIQSAPRMRNVTPVPMGPLVQKKGEFKGSTLKKGGKLKKAKVGAWQRKEGKSESGGLNAKGRASYNRETGGNLKPPQPEGGPRKRSFCARMKGHKRKNTSSKTARDPNSRINKALRKWKC
jgi:hypothetical protein